MGRWEEGGRGEHWREGGGEVDGGREGERVGGGREREWEGGRESGREGGRSQSNQESHTELALTYSIGHDVVLVLWCLCDVEGWDGGCGEQGSRRGLLHLYTWEARVDQR